MNCPYCPNEIADTSKFCPKCGHLIVRCPSCNKIITYKTQFCPDDGTKIDPALTTDLPPYVPEKKERQPKKISVQATSNKRFCKKCGKVCNEGQALCDACSKPQKKSPVPIILIVLLIIALLIGGAFAVIKLMDVNPADNGINSSDVSRNEDTDETSDDAPSVDAYADTHSDVEKESDESKETESSDNENVAEPAESDNAASVVEPTAEEATQTEMDVAENASRYSNNVTTLDGHAYAIFNFKDEGYSSYNECAEFCERMGGHLAVIESAAENDFLFQFIKDSGLHLAFFGYTDQENEGYWKWEKGSSSFTNWDEGQPNNGAKNKGKKAENYAEFSKSAANGTWNDAPFGSNTYHFICEWE